MKGGDTCIYFFFSIAIDCGWWTCLWTLKKILDLLQKLTNLDSFNSMSREALQQHVKYIIKTSTQNDPLLLLPFLAPQLPFCSYEYKAVRSPRLCSKLYTICLKSKADAEHFAAEKTMEEVRILSNEVPQVPSEIFLASRDETERQTWLYLILLAQLRVPCHRPL
ncbi:unnamed protein product [Symbiodinium sp. CCMP2456]|nr:unnamed protein product [Symbiodinium sp. CCMP2456]